jgi:hypothetical protein
MTATLDLLRREFPEFDVATLPAIPDGFECCAWHNDTCPVWFETSLAPMDSTDAATRMMIAIDYADASIREYPESPRFGLHMQDGDDCSPEIVCQSNDWSKIVAAVHFIRFVRKLGLAFHPDTRGVDYINEDGSRTFSDDEAEIYEASIDAVMDDTDAYEFGLRIWAALKLIEA